MRKKGRLAQKMVGILLSIVAASVVISGCKASSEKKEDKAISSEKNMTLEDKKRLKGLQPKRADIITAGVVILDIIMEKLEINEIIVSEYDNLEGLMCQIAKKMS